MKKLLIILVVIAILVGGVFITGHVLPQKHSVTLTDTIQAPRQEVFQRVKNIQDYTLWRKAVRETEVIAPGEWLEIDHNKDTIHYRMTILQENQRILTTIESDHLAFGGHRIFRFEALNGEATELTITENGEIYVPFLRVYRRFISGYDENLKEYIRNLKLSFGGI